MKAYIGVMEFGSKGQCEALAAKLSHLPIEGLEVDDHSVRFVAPDVLTLLPLIAADPELQWIEYIIQFEY